MNEHGGARVFAFDDRKFDELLLYVAERYEDDETFGSVKLNKILYFSDFTAYRDLGSPITGATYLKLPAGPGARQMRQERFRLEDAGHAIIMRVPFFAGVQKRLVAQRHPDLDLFSTEEMSIVNTIIEFFRGWTGREVSDFSHKEPGWVLAEYGEAIPYETAWLSREFIDSDTWETVQQYAGASRE